jgi:tetratricopeptide (TPR) repeat protein
MLRNYLWRIGWLLVVLSCSGLLLLVGYRNLSIRFIADPRFQIDRTGLLTIHRNIPESPRLNIRLAESYLADVANGEQALEAASYHSRLAANHSLWDYRAAHTLGTILEIGGDLEGAERALRAAVRLSPNFTPANWALGNLLVRQSRQEEALQFLGNAARLDQSLYPSVFELIGESSGGDATVALRMTANDPEAQLSLVNYLMEQSRDEPALELFRQIDVQYRQRSSRTLPFITRQLEIGQAVRARQLWIELYPPKGTADSGVSNGGFEQETMLDRADQKDLESLFDWSFAPSSYARIGIDTGSAESATRSLRIIFVGKDTTTLMTEIRQLLALEPGASYRLSFSYRTSLLTSPLGPRVAVTSDNGIVAQSAPIQNGTSGSWIKSSFDFRAPNDRGRKYVSIIRQPQFSYDDPTSGIVWFDDFSLAEINSGTEP